MSVSRKDATFIDALGVEIHYHVWPHPSPKGVVQIVHGVGEYALRYEVVAAELVAAGYEVWADDHRGHGRTGLKQWAHDPSRLGRLGKGGHRAAVDAVHRLSKLIKAARPTIPFVLLGHSWGSFISQILLNEYPSEYDFVILSGSAYRTLTGMNAAPLNAKHGKTVASPTGYEWLSRDPAVIAAAAADPLMVATPLIRLFGIRDTLRLLGKPRIGLADEHDVPLLLLVGSDDPVGGERSVRRLAEAYLARARLSDVRVIVYDDARHEILNETNRDEVTTDIVDWLDARIS